MNASLLSDLITLYIVVVKGPKLDVNIVCNVFLPLA